MVEDLKAIEKIVAAVRQHVVRREHQQALAAIDLLSDKVAEVRDSVEAAEFNAKVENYR